MKKQAKDLLGVVHRDGSAFGKPKFSGVTVSGAVGIREVLESCRGWVVVTVATNPEDRMRLWSVSGVLPGSLLGMTIFEDNEQALKGLLLFPDMLNRPGSWQIMVIGDEFIRRFTSGSFAHPLLIQSSPV